MPGNELIVQLYFIPENIITHHPVKTSFTMYTYSYNPSLLADNCDGCTIDVDNDSVDDGGFCTAEAHIFGLDFKSRVKTVHVAVLGHDICTVAHEVVVTAIKCTVMWISHDPADTNCS